MLHCLCMSRLDIKGRMLLEGNTSGCCCSAYSLSKLAMMMFNAELGGRLSQAGSPVTANSLDPGNLC